MPPWGGNRNDADAAPDPNYASSSSSSSDDAMAGRGTILEAAFYDPAYLEELEEKAENEGSPVELKATDHLLASATVDDDNESKELSLRSSLTLSKSLSSDADKEETITIERRKITKTETTEKYRGFPCWKCCRKTEEQVVETYEEGPTDEEIQQKIEERQREITERREKERAAKEQRARDRYEKRLQKIAKEKEEAEAEEMRRKADKYGDVPEGLLVYRLDTGRGRLDLLSKPHPKYAKARARNELVSKMSVVSAYPEPNDKHRRSITLVGVDGSKTTLHAAEQRTAVAWLEASEMMIGRRGGGDGDGDYQSWNHGTYSVTPGSGRQEWKSGSGWKSEDMTDNEKFTAEEEYMNLANYSNTLILSDATGDKANTDSSKRAQGPGGAYYNITSRAIAGADELDEETLESIAKRRSVIGDSWDFYRMICSLMRDRKKYDECFNKMTLDPVYPYLNSMMGLNDPEENDWDSRRKKVVQQGRAAYKSMGPSQLAKEMISKAEEALPSLVEICKALAGSLGMEEVGVGPIKEVSSAIKKAERKYEGDLLKVTDYCRALLVVRDFPTLLALLELARDSFGPLIKRVKLSSLKQKHKSLTGGYRDCKINIELKEHICEIQVHLWPMWLVCGVDGFRHYRHCLEYATDSFQDPYDSLDGLERKTRAEMIVMAEEAVAPMPLETLQWYHEKYILDYFAEVGLFLKHGLWAWAETTLRRLIKLRSESPDIGIDHYETLQLQRYLALCLGQQGKQDEANEIGEKLEEYQRGREREVEEAENSLFDSIMDGALCGCGPSDSGDAGAGAGAGGGGNGRGGGGSGGGGGGWFQDSRRQGNDFSKKAVRASKKHWIRIRQERFKFLDGQNVEDTVQM